MRPAPPTLYISVSSRSSRAHQEGERRFLAHHSLRGHPHLLVRGPIARYASPKCEFSTPRANRSASCPTEEAIKRAEEAGLDLIEVAATAEPPVCRIADLGKFKFESDKRARDAKKNQHVSEVKEVRIRPRTDDHDLQVRVRAARRFLEEGHKVKVEVRFRGARRRTPRWRGIRLGASPRAWPTSRSWNGRRRWKGGRCSRFWRVGARGRRRGQRWRMPRRGRRARSAHRRQRLRQRQRRRQPAASGSRRQQRQRQRRQQRQRQPAAPAAAAAAPAAAQPAAAQPAPAGGSSGSAPAPPGAAAGGSSACGTACGGTCSAPAPAAPACGSGAGGGPPRACGDQACADAADPADPAEGGFDDPDALNRQARHARALPGVSGGAKRPSRGSPREGARSELALARSSDWRRGARRAPRPGQHNSWLPDPFVNRGGLDPSTTRGLLPVWRVLPCGAYPGHSAPRVWHTMRAGAFRCCVVHFVATEPKPCDRPMPARVERVFRRSVWRWRPIPL